MLDGASFSISGLRQVDVLGANASDTPPFYGVNITLSFQVQVM